MLSLCSDCHAKVHHTKAVLSAMPALLVELWREQHPQCIKEWLFSAPSSRPRKLTMTFSPQFLKRERLMQLLSSRGSKQA